MDKKQKNKLVPAVCFVLVCGVVSLGIHYSRQREERIVLEKQDDRKVTQETEKFVESEDGTVVGEAVTIREETLCVHICGAVGEEGVYTLPAGSRLTDGIEAAGGFIESADTTYHNLAAYLTDGQKIYVPTVEETKELSVSQRLENIGKNENGGTSAPSGTENQKVNINTADFTELMTLSGIGEAKAESILQYRERVGLFQCVEELKNVSGIGDAMFERVKEHITVE